jgi:hypothetical protein
VVLLVPAAGFTGLVIAHARVLNTPNGRRAPVYERARSSEQHVGGHRPQRRAFLDRHLYARDPDLFGRASLFELLDTARTDAGEALAAWLRGAARADGCAHGRPPWT